MRITATYIHCRRSHRRRRCDADDDWKIMQKLQMQKFIVSGARANARNTI